MARARGAPSRPRQRDHPVSIALLLLPALALACRGARGESGTLGSTTHASAIEGATLSRSWAGARVAAQEELVSRRRATEAQQQKQQQHQQQHAWTVGDEAQGVREVAPSPSSGAADDGSGKATLLSARPPARAVGGRAGEGQAGGAPRRPSDVSSSGGGDSSASVTGREASQGRLHALLLVASVAAAAGFWAGWAVRGVGGGGGGAAAAAATAAEGGRRRAAAVSPAAAPPAPLSSGKSSDLDAPAPSVPDVDAARLMAAKEQQQRPQKPSPPPSEADATSTAAAREAAASSQTGAARPPRKARQEPPEEERDDAGGEDDCASALVMVTTPAGVGGGERQPLEATTLLAGPSALPPAAAAADLGSAATAVAMLPRPPPPLSPPPPPAAAASSSFSPPPVPLQLHVSFALHCGDAEQAHALLADALRRLARPLAAPSAACAALAERATALLERGVLAAEALFGRLAALASAAERLALRAEARDGADAREGRRAALLEAVRFGEGVVIAATAWAALRGGRLWAAAAACSAAAEEEQAGRGAPPLLGGVRAAASATRWWLRRARRRAAGAAGGWLLGPLSLSPPLPLSAPSAFAAPLPLPPWLARPACYAHRTAMYAAAAWVLYQVARGALLPRLFGGGGLSSSPGASSSSSGGGARGEGRRHSASAWAVDLLLRRALAQAAAGAYVAHGLGASAGLWLALWWAWCAVQALALWRLSDGAGRAARGGGGGGAGGGADGGGGGGGKRGGGVMAAALDVAVLLAVGLAMPLAVGVLPFSSAPDLLSSAMFGNDFVV